MNERIKELAKEAGYYLYDLTETHECKTVETDSEDEWITLEKFAQLIVRECLKLNSKELSITAIERLLPLYKEHFGVEK
jgi:hypothetical protein